MPKTLSTLQFDELAIEFPEEVKGKLVTSFKGETDEFRTLVEHKAKKQEKDFTVVYAEILFSLVLENRYNTRIASFNTTFIRAARAMAALKGTDAAIKYLMSMTELTEAQALTAITKN